MLIKNSALSYKWGPMSVNQHNAPKKFKRGQQLSHKHGQETFQILYFL